MIPTLQMQEFTLMIINVHDLRSVTMFIAHTVLVYYCMQLLSLFCLHIQLHRKYKHFFEGCIILKMFLLITSVIKSTSTAPNA